MNRAHTNPIPKISAAFLACTAAVACAGPISMSSVFHTDLPSGLMSEVNAAFPGNGKLDQMDPSLFTNDANMILAEETNVTLTFLDERAGYHNQIGYFTYDDNGSILDQGIVFDDFSKGNPDNGYLTAGDSIEIGTFDAGTNLGFYIVPNGKMTPHYTLDALNPNQDNYTAFYYDETNNMGILGFEDLRWKPASGTAYNDALVGISTSPAPEPMSLALLAIGSIAIIRRR